MTKVLLRSLLFFSALWSASAAGSANLVKNSGLEISGTSPGGPADFTLQGPAVWGKVGGPDEIASRGIIIPGDASSDVVVSQMVLDLDQKNGRWLTFTFRGLAEDGFTLKDDTLSMKMEFYSQNGTHHLEEATRLISREIMEERRVLAVNGDHGRGGAAVWRTYGFEELIPFAEVDAVKISVIFKSGAKPSHQGAVCYLDGFSLEQSQASPTGRVAPTARETSSVVSTPVDEKKLLSLGGRWYYEPLPDEQRARPLTVTEDNADRLYYKAGGWTTPFAHNMTAWLRAGHLDRNGDEVTKDRFLPDNVVLTFKGDGYLTMRAKNIPNHPTAKFPDTMGTQGYNPNHIQELDKTYRLPLEPVLNPQAIATDTGNLNHALPMGAIGVAINGVVFYNPFDAGNNDASSIMDRCCGHPSPDNRYHYHKYPICVNTPFVDKGQGHSGLIGFAFDGLPLYGPYESEGVMARDSKTNPLNAFNAHYDAERGWHYHVSPGKFPYLIGGYFAKVDSSNLERRPMGPPGGGGDRPPPPDF